MLARQVGVGGIFITADALDPRDLSAQFAELADPVGVIREGLNDTVVVIDNPRDLRDMFGLDVQLLVNLLVWNANEGRDLARATEAEQRAALREMVAKRGDLEIVEPPAE